MNLELRKGCSNVILGKSQIPVTEVQIFNLSICKKTNVPNQNSYFMLLAFLLN